MSIPESQLATWSASGAQKGSADTYASITSALQAHDWSSNMKNYSVYLQGSYRNSTNIRGDSDVDVIVESLDMFYHDVPLHEQARYGIVQSSFTWFEFRDEVKKALSNRYGALSVNQGSKCIKVTGHGNRLNADVIPCTTYRSYSLGDAYLYVEGIAFLTNDRTQIVNYPKLHLENGWGKNRNCDDNYKPNIRVFKNARNRAGSEFPSYFLECLLYNVPDYCFDSSYSKTFHDVLHYLCGARDGNSLSSFLYQNRQQYMFGAHKHQISVLEAHPFINALVELWNNW